MSSSRKQSRRDGHSRLLAPGQHWHRSSIAAFHHAHTDCVRPVDAAQVKARRLLPAARGGAGGAAASSSSSSCKSQGSSVSGDADADDADSVDAGGEYKAYRYILLPPENKFIRVRLELDVRGVDVLDAGSARCRLSSCAPLLPACVRPQLTPHVELKREVNLPRCLRSCRHADRRLGPPAATCPPTVHMPSSRDACPTT